MQGPGVNQDAPSGAAPEYSVRGQGLDEAVDPAEAHPHDGPDFAEGQELHVVDVHRTVLRQVHFHLGCLQLQHLLLSIPDSYERLLCQLLDTEQQPLSLLGVTGQLEGYVELNNVSVGQSLHPSARTMQFVVMSQLRTSAVVADWSLDL